MKTKKKKFDIEDWLLLIGGTWLLFQLFKTPKKAGIGALPDANRKLIPYETAFGNGFLQDMQKYDRNEQGEIIRLIIDARIRPVLQMPLWKNLTGTLITGEFRKKSWRIFAYEIDDETYLMLSLFKKESNETPLPELRKAEKRLKEYLSGKIK